MITKDSLKELLSLLNFSNTWKVWEKEINWIKFYVDFEKGKLWFPEWVTINDKTTSNLDKKENFVVFECVHRLVEKWYRPEHIELEPRWKLWHDSKSWKADIQIKDNNGKSLLLIECKTPDWEFKSYWKKTLEDGDQLFSYFQQEKSTKFLCMYASDIVDGKVKPEYHLINVQDNEELLKNLPGKKRKTYKEASTNKELFEVWKEIYQQDFSTRGLFEEDIAAYDIWKYKYSINDLEEVDSEAIQKKYNEFAVILRQHNVSWRENAFDKLVNLFLAKVVDERNNPKELAFYWKWAAYDDYFHLQDRLQKLYKDGMEKFLNETVTYIDNDDIEKAFKLFKKDPDATKSAILNYLRELKFFTNNDFAFIDVHNEHLFYQNAEILKKIVQMLQDIKLKTETQNQFLWDLFEWFLDQGVKQNEGQFFTPMPIVKFLVSSLPLEDIINQSEIPLAIDYACWAGHFLNEYATQIKKYVEDKGWDIKEYYNEITGIEKEYRLSKVSKVASFMYGQDEIKIIYADALAKNELEEKYKVKDGTYSILIANPPYSVKWFLETLPVEDQEKFELTNEVSDKSKNNSIEAFFIERASQLLKDGWVAAIILPSSILSNGNIYIKTREILLQKFDIVAIAEFWSGTFGKTWTNTVTLFLRKKSSKPNLAEHYQNRINCWFSWDFTKDKVFEDEELIKAYCEKIQVSYEEYKKLFDWELSEELKKNEIFVEYQNVFKEKKLDKQKKKLIDFVIEIEKEKLYFFIFAKINPQPVLLIKSPSDNKAIKSFLWYEWKAAKWNEGIHYLWAWDTKEDDEDFISKNKWINRIKTPLFDPHNLDSEEKINTLIRKNFLWENFEISWDLSEFVSRAYLVDMIDFNGASFDKIIKTSAVKKIEFESKYPLIGLNNFEVQKWNSITSATAVKWNIKVVAWWIDFAYYHNQANREKNIITISASGANAGFINYWSEPIFASDCTTIRWKSDLNTLYIYYFLKWNQDVVYWLQKWAAQPHVYPDDIKKLKIPDVDETIQKKIVEECKKIDEEFDHSEKKIKEWKKKIEGIIENTKWKDELIENICLDIFAWWDKPADFSEKKTDEKNIPVIANWTDNHWILWYTAHEKVNQNCITVSWRGTIWYCETRDYPFFPVVRLIVAIPNKDKILLPYFKYIIDTIKFSNTWWTIPQLTVPVFKKHVIKVPPIEIQKEIVSKIESIEKEMGKAKQIMDTCASSKKAVLDKYLK